MSITPSGDCSKEGKFDGMSGSIRDLELKQVRTEGVLDRIEEKLEDQRSSLEKIAMTLSHFERMMGEIVSVKAGMEDSRKHRFELETELNAIQESMQKVIVNVTAIEVEVRELKDDIASQRKDMEDIETYNHRLSHQVASLVFANKLAVGIAGLVLAGILPSLFEKMLH